MGVGPHRNLREDDNMKLIASCVSTMLVAGILVRAQSLPVATPKPTGGRGLTEVHGIKVGQHTLSERPTGCTVIIVDGEGVPGGVSQRGGAPGTSETDLLDPVNMVDKVNAIVLSGGSAYGLDARQGVVRFLEENNIGWKVSTGVVPIVPAAVLIDLHLGGKPKIRPSAACGYEAAKSATTGPVAEGNVGAGAGATVGWWGNTVPGGSMKGGLGSAAFVLPNGLVVAAIAAVNAGGDIVDPETGKIVAGARTKDGKSLADVRNMLRTGGFATGGQRRAGENTTLGVVATNARLSKTDVNRVALMADDGFARAINPSHTTGDGDTVFALATGRWNGEASLSVIGALAADAMAEAIVRAVSKAESVEGVPSAKELGTVPGADQVVGQISRRGFLATSCLGAAELTLRATAVNVGPAPVPRGFSRAIIQSNRPSTPQGVAAGDVVSDRAIIWSRTDRPARMVVEYSTSDKFTNPLRQTGAVALDTSDYTARTVLRELPSGQRVFYRVLFQDLSDLRAWSEPHIGSFRTPETGTPQRDVTLAWSADTVGQGWGINAEWGGLKLYEAMRRAEPDVFIHCGDTIYADQHVPAEITLDDGAIWKNVVTEAKSKVAESLDEFRGNYKYNLLDEHMRRFNAEIPEIVLWDDHEVRDNWYQTRDLQSDDRYQVKSTALLAARARQAFLEFNPVGRSADDAERIYRVVPYSPLVDVFVMDLRSYRGANSANRQTALTPDASDRRGRTDRSR